MGIDFSARGVIYTATGNEKYAQLATRSAKSIKQYNPGLQVDLYTDLERGSDVFDKVHLLANPWERSKIDAMRLSRFDRTLMLDCDTLCMAPINTVFETLDRFDLAVAYDYCPNGLLNFERWKTQVPSAMPHFNSGVIAIRRSPDTDRFLTEWADAVRDHNIGRDQPSLRELLYTSDLRFLVLPEAFNLLQVSHVSSWTACDLAPRIVHSPHFHNEFRRYAKVDNPVLERAGLRNYWKIMQLRRYDRDIALCEGRPAVTPSRWDGVRFLAWALPRMPRRIVEGSIRALLRWLRPTPKRQGP